MRRSRIKAVATVPVRRKTNLDNLVNESDTKEHDVKVIAKLSSENLKSNTESTSESIPIKEEKELNSLKSKNESTTKENECLLPKEKATASPIEAKEAESNVSIISVKTELKNNVQQASKVELQKTSASTTEASPIKAVQNRSCFMRPTPRLDGGGRIRRNSIQGSGASASESEDDSKRSHPIVPNRARNDSICSVQSLKENSNARLNLGQKRRMVVSESARKLAEARREFLLKHENKSPDKSKLTMYDLIYYNPTTNPMKPKPTSKPAARKISVCSIPDKTNEDDEEVVEPAEMLVPQVKVGPNGQLIIDEQSLVIDQYKAQENIDRSDIIVDEDTTGNGFYKRRQKSKDWNKWETVKFYKALNTYGTDFLLMQSIFPKRTRQELKLKYKKEEKLNRNLVEKALIYQEFDTEALEKDLASVEESERKETESRKTKKESNSSTKRKRKRCQIVAEEVNCVNDDQNSELNKTTCDGQSSDENARITITKKVRKRQTRKRKELKLDTNDDNESGRDNSDSGSEMYQAKPTRSGRLPRKTKKLKKSIIVYDTTDIEQTEQVDQENTNELIYNHDINDINEEKNKKIVINDIEKNLLDSDNIENSKIIIEDTDDTVDQICNIPSNKEDINQISNMPKSEEIKDQNQLLEMLGVNSKITSNTFDGIIDDIPNMTNLKPGSLVVLKKDNVDEPGKTTLQVYIVSADYDNNNPNCKDSLLPIDLSPDILETVTNCIKEIEPQNVC